MTEFYIGKSGKAEEALYQKWLTANQGGYVVSLNRGRSGKFTVHKAECQTVWYELPKRQRKRSGKVCCKDKAEIGTVKRTRRGAAVLNSCGRCGGLSD